MWKYPSDSLLVLARSPVWTEATSTDAPETAASGRVIRKNGDSNKTARTSRAALILPLITLLQGPAC